MNDLTLCRVKGECAIGTINGYWLLYRLIIGMYKLAVMMPLSKYKKYF